MCENNQKLLTFFLENENMNEFFNEIKQTIQINENEQEKIMQIQQISKLLSKIGPISIELATQLITKCYKLYGTLTFSLFENLEISNFDFNSFFELFSIIKESKICTKFGEFHSLFNDMKEQINDLYYELDKNSSNLMKNCKKPISFYSDIFHAASVGNIASISYLLQKKPELINSKDDKGQTPLILASWKGQTKTVDYLLSKGADVNIRTLIGSTAAMYASESDSIDVLNLLKENGADFNITNNTGSTALSYAALRNSTKAAQFLIDNGVNVNDADANGATPLFCATFTNSIDVARILVKNGADLTLQNIQGRVAKEYCTTIEMAQFYYDIEHQN